MSQGSGGAHSFAPHSWSLEVVRHAVAAKLPTVPCVTHRDLACQLSCKRTNLKHCPALKSMRRFLSVLSPAAARTSWTIPCNFPSFADAFTAISTQIGAGQVRCTSRWPMQHIENVPGASRRDATCRSRGTRSVLPRLSPAGYP